MSEEDVELSPRGKRRSDEILRYALEETRNRKRKRQIFQLGVIACGMIAIALIVMDLRVPTNRSARVIPSTQTSPNVMFAIISTDPTIAERLSVAPQPPQWTEIDDDQLLKELADAGQPAGIIQMDGRTILIPR